MSEGALFTGRDQAWLQSMDRAFDLDLKDREKLQAAAIRWCDEAREHSKRADQLQATNDCLAIQVENQRQQIIEMTEGLQAACKDSKRNRTAFRNASVIAFVGWGLFGFVLVKVLWR